MSKVILEYKVASNIYRLDCKDFTESEIAEFFKPIYDLYVENKKLILESFFGENYTRKDELKIDTFFPLNMMLTAYKYELYHDKFHRLPIKDKVQEFKKFCNGDASLYVFSSVYATNIHFREIIDALNIFTDLRQKIIDSPAEYVSYSEDLMNLGNVQLKVLEFLQNVNLKGEDFAEYAYVSLFNFARLINSEMIDEEFECVGRAADSSYDSDVED